jgi:hypothetical protein
MVLRFIFWQEELVSGRQVTCIGMDGFTLGSFKRYFKRSEEAAVNDILLFQFGKCDSGQPLALVVIGQHLRFLRHG